VRGNRRLKISSEKRPSHEELPLGHQIFRKMVQTFKRVLASLGRSKCDSLRSRAITDTTHRADRIQRASLLYACSAVLIYLDLIK
jgi:hypothetical protein